MKMLLKIMLIVDESHLDDILDNTIILSILCCNLLFKTCCIINTIAVIQVEMS